MTAHHAIEITLTRPATDCELRRARHVVTLASNTDHTRLLTLQRAKTPGRALRALRHRLDAVLPIDVLTSHYPDRQGCVLLKFALSHTARTALRQAAAACGQRPRDFLSKTVPDAVARHEEERARRLTIQLEALLAQHSPEELLLCAASTLLSHDNRRPSGKPSATPS
ncbi:hypothetical protein PXH67_11085 [Streptomyces sp. P8-A8]|uniref:hypothetical protein n=1 Tax=unclassified Streptomyces TaxID=2593676 RepID=UPI002DDC8528|nr:hypothetical protein [Streptomyces sp. NBC_01768]WSC31108.1 hypothetical protein OG902_32890 [Streptomyces sp. NBC_01768]